MIEQIIIFIFGFLFASFLRLIKVITIIAPLRKQIKIDAAEAEKMQREFMEKGDSKELQERQIKSVVTLNQHIGKEEVLKKFNYLIW